MKNYGRIIAVRAKGCIRRRSMVSGKILFDSYDSNSYDNKTIIIMPDQNINDLSDSDMEEILRMVGIQDDPSRVYWEDQLPVRVTDPTNRNIIWNYLLHSGFSFLDNSISIRRDINDEENTISYKIGHSNIITREEIKKERNDAIALSIVTALIVFGLIFLLLSIKSN